MSRSAIYKGTQVEIRSVPVVGSVVGEVAGDPLLCLIKCLLS